MIDLNDLINRWNAGATSPELAKFYGVSAPYIRSRISRLRRDGHALEDRAQRPAMVCDGPDIMNLRENLCRYITGENAHGAVYCKQPMHYKSYCEVHAKRCFVTPRQYGIAVDSRNAPASPVWR